MYGYGKGPYGVNIDFADYVSLDNVKVDNVINTGPARSFLCYWSWVLYETQDYLGPSVLEYKGSDTHGVSITKAYQTMLRDVMIDNISSDEGRATGLDLQGDESSRALFVTADTPYISTDNVVIGKNITGGQPGLATGFLMGKQYMTTGGVQVSEIEDLQVCSEEPENPFASHPHTPCLG